MNVSLKNLPRRILGKIRWLAQRRTLRAQQRAVRAREERLNAMVDAGGGRFVLATPALHVEILKGPGARLNVHGEVVIRSDLGGDRPVKICVATNGLLEFRGDFILGDGVLIIVSEGARLTIGGRKHESGAGITCDTKILVAKAMDIGTDFICAWHVFLTDSDHHQIKGQCAALPVRIGDHVWIAHGSSVLKGCDIGDGCIVAAHAVAHRQTFPPRSLIAGVPAKLAKAPVEWSRDLQPLAV